jgi:hypothetical protein
MATYMHPYIPATFFFPRPLIDHSYDSPKLTLPFFFLLHPLANPTLFPSPTTRNPFVRRIDELDRISPPPLFVFLNIQALSTRPDADMQPVCTMVHDA